MQTDIIAKVNAHILKCADCRKVYDTILKVYDMLQGLRADQESKKEIIQGSISGE